MKTRNPQDYSPEEFDAAVQMIRSDPGLREDIEVITGQALEGMSPRELFNTFRAIQRAADVQKAVVEYGHARQAVRATRAMLAEAALHDLDPADPAAKKIRELETRLDELKVVNARLKGTNKALMARRTIGPVIKGEVAS